MSFSRLAGWVPLALCPSLISMAYIALENDLPITAVVAAKGVQHAGEGAEIDDTPFFDPQGRILVPRLLPDDTADARHGRAAKIVGPVQLDKGGQNQGKGQPDRFQITVLPAQPDVVDGGFIRTFGARAPKTRPLMLKWEKSTG